MTQKLYRYRVFNEYLFSLLINQEVYFADPSEFNDPFDCDSIIKITPEFYEDPEKFMGPILREMETDAPDLARNLRLGIRQELAKGNIEGVKEYILKKFRGNDGTRDGEGLGVLCLSKNCTNVAQWAYYANSNTGLCLEFL